MAIAEAFSGTETVTQATEWSMTTDTAGPDVQTGDGVYQFYLDLSALVKGDKARFRVYEKVLSSGTQRIVFEAFFANVQASPIWVSPTLILMHGWDGTIQMVTATSRSIDFSVRQVA